MITARGRNRSALATAGLLALAASGGCGGGGSGATGSPDAASPDGAGDTTSPLVDLSGWYQVTSYTTGPCGAPQPSTLGPAFVWVERRVSTFIFNACSGSTEADCTGTLFYDFSQPIAHGATAEGGSAFYSAGCTLTWERTAATLDGSALHAQSLRDSATSPDTGESACTLAAASLLTGPCTFEIDLVATRL
jgi:hypothetical protein